LTLVLRKGVHWDVGFLAVKQILVRSTRTKIFFLTADTPPYNSPLLQVFEGVDQNIKIKCVWTVEIILICMSLAVFLGTQRLVEGILQLQVRDAIFSL
jgi:hypothetical protein